MCEISFKSVHAIRSWSSINFFTSVPGIALSQFVIVKGIAIYCTGDSFNFSPTLRISCTFPVCLNEHHVLQVLLSSPIFLHTGLYIQERTILVVVKNVLWHTQHLASLVCFADVVIMLHQCGIHMVISSCYTSTVTHK